MRVLVALASYGTNNDRYLGELIKQYRSMPYKTRVVVISNVPKDLGPEVEVIVGLPNKNPRSLPHAHKRLFFAAANDFDLFIYSEDDHLITARNIEAFLEVTPVLPEDAVAGFVVSESDTAGNSSFPAFHGRFHWDVFSVKRAGTYVFAAFSNEHSASYMVTRRQLRRAIESGGFLVSPHSGKYDLLCSAATDIYTQCGFRRLICISRLSDFTLAHLPNKYVGRLGITGQELDTQVYELLRIARGGTAPRSLVKSEPALAIDKFSKCYYERPRADLASLVPPMARKVLSLGCGWGATEKLLVDRGMEVVGVPMDSVIGRSSALRGINVVAANLDTLEDKFTDGEFDCILCLSLLHLVPEPEKLIRVLGRLLSTSGLLILGVPNCDQLSTLWHRVRRDQRYRTLGKFAVSGIHLTSRPVVSQWLQRSGLRVQLFAADVPLRASVLDRATGGIFRRLLQPEVVAVASHSPSAVTR